VLPTELPSRSGLAATFSLAARGVAALVVFVAFLGWNWPVVVLLVLYLVDVVLPDFVRSVPAPAWTQLLIPQNLGKVFFLTFASALSVIVLQSFVSSSTDVVLYSLLIVMLVAIVNNVASARWQPTAGLRPVVLYSGGLALAIVTPLQLTDHLVRS
jgi:hypothetical protein